MELAVSGLTVFSILAFLFALVQLGRQTKGQSIEFGLASVQGKILSATLIVSFIGIVSGSAYFALREIRSDVQQSLSNSLNTLLDTTQEGIQIWVNEQIARMEQDASHPTVILATSQLIWEQQEGNPLLNSPAQQVLRRHFELQQSTSAVKGFFIVAPDGTNISSMRSNNIGTINPILEHDPTHFARAMNGESQFVAPIPSDVPIEGQPSITGLDVPASIFFASPIIDASGRTIAVLTKRYNPYDVFSSILRLGRIGESGESYAFNEAGLMISETRFLDTLIETGRLSENQSSILSTRLTVPGQDSNGADRLTLMAEMALRGERGSNLEGYLDYRGVPVIGVWNWNETLEIGITTEIDFDKGYQPYYKARQIILIILGITVAIALLYTLFLIRVSTKSTHKLQQQSAELEDRVAERTDALKESERVLQLIIDTVPAPLYMKDRQGKYQMINAEYTRVVGFKLEEVIGKTDAELLPNDIASSVMAIDEEIMSTVQRKVLEEQVPNPEGELRAYQSFKSPVVNPSGGVMGLVGVSMDITDRIQLENDLLDSKVRAEEGSRAKSEFLASMSHEIRTPLNGVLGMLGLVRRQGLAKKQDEQLAIAQSSANSLLDIINDLLDFSKIEAQKLDIEELDFNIQELLGDVAKTVAYKADEKGLELILDLSGLDQKVIRSDPTRIRQLVLNLLSNAIKFTVTGEIVLRATLEIHDNKHFLQCSVIDSGIGIKDDVIAKLFDEFTQADSSTTRQYGGTGLGLAICKRLSELMGGGISVKSELGRGSEFTFRVEIQESRESPKFLPTHELKGLRVLIVDDIKTNRQIFRAQLEAWGVVVSEVESGKEALALLAEKPEGAFDIALLDMNMPGMDGYELALSIHEDERLANLKMLLMTSSSEFENSKALLSLGLSGYFAKPVTPSDLHDALLVVMDRRAEETEEQTVITSGYLKTLSRESTEDFTDLQEKLNILLVEDNAINRMIVHGMLEAMQLKCTEVENGQEAIDYLNTHENKGKINLILMDCQMPILDGYQTTEQIRAGNAGAWATNIPIIAMTAHALQGDKEKCLACGMNDFVTKPVNEQQFREALKRWADYNPDSLSPSSDSQTDTTDQGDNNMTTQGLKWPDNLKLIDPAQPPAFANYVPQFIAALTVFAEKAHEEMRLFQSDFASQDLTDLGKRAHGLKGSTGNLGFMALSQLAAEIEQAVKADETISALQITELKDLYERAMLDAQSIIQANTAETSKTGKPWREIAQEIMTLLEQSQLVSVELIQDLQASDVPPEHQQALQSVGEQLNNFEYDDALKLLQEIM